MLERWYREIVQCDPTKPGIYEWRIARTDKYEGGCYIGQYTRASRPRRAYGRIVARLLAHLVYRPSDPEGFRRIHRALAKAKESGFEVTLTLLENCAAKKERNRREGELIEDRRAKALAGGLRVLNATLPARVRKS